ncbi:MAG: hypothetical protein C5B50_22690 [Verrucomicrobia bacterium]|nr:MAG: hypothetical protein C5B50_22690 [Verrucomicrobiota bacterium]
MTESPTTVRPPRTAPALLPSLGLFTTVMMVVGGVIGSGIFKKPAIMAAQVGSPGLLLMVWLLAGVLTLFGALTIAEITGIIPETGGQYVYFERIFGPFTGFLYGWACFAVIQTGSIAAVAYIFAEYAAQFIRLPEFSPALSAWSVHLYGLGDVTPFRDIGVKGIAALLIFILTVVNYVGVRFGGLVQNIFTIAKVAAMAALMLGAFLLPAGGAVSHLTTHSTIIHPQGLALILATVASLQGAFWAYDGWIKLTYIAGEIKEPQLNLPRALGLGLLLVTLIYMLMNLAYAYVLPVDQMAKSKLVAADVAERCFQGGGRWIAAAVMISTFGTTNSIILATARVFYSMAHQNVFPKFLGKVHPRFHTPGPSLVVQGVWSALLLFSGTFDTLTDTLIFISWIFYAASAWGVFVLRRREPYAPRPYHAPGYPFVPAIFILFAVLYLVFTVYNDFAAYRAAVAAGKPALINSIFGTVLVLSGAPIYLYYRTRPRQPDT